MWSEGDQWDWFNWNIWIDGISVFMESVGVVQWELLHIVWRLSVDVIQWVCSGGEQWVWSSGCVLEGNSGCGPVGVFWRGTVGVV